MVPSGTLRATACDVLAPELRAADRQIGTSDSDCSSSDYFDSGSGSEGGGETGYGDHSSDSDSAGSDAGGPGSGGVAFSSVLCTAVADIFLDGTAALLVGTHDHRLLAYASRSGGDGAGPGTGAGVSQQGNGDGGDAYEIVWERCFSAPVFGVCLVDLDGDGIDEIVVSTLDGVHVLRAPQRHVAQRVTGAAGLLREIMELEAQVKVKQEKCV